MAIEVLPWAKKVDIRNNTIKNFRRGICIQSHMDLESDLLVEMNVEENSFDDISEEAVAERTMSRQQPKIKGTDKCRLRGSTGSGSSNILCHIN